MKMSLKRYANRKYYYSAERRYCTLKEIEDFLVQGGEVQVTCHYTKNDITEFTLRNLVAQRRVNKLDRQQLMNLIRGGQ